MHRHATRLRHLQPQRLIPDVEDVEAEARTRRAPPFAVLHSGLAGAVYRHGSIPPQLRVWQRLMSRRVLSSQHLGTMAYSAASERIHRPSSTRIFSSSKE